MEKKIGRFDTDYVQLLYENDNISIYELDAIHLGTNRASMNIDEACVEASLPSFADAPLYCVIDNQFNPLDGEHNDFMEHFREEYPWKISRDRILPFGVVPESSIPLAKLVERDGHTYLRLQVVVWKRLLPHVSEILQRRDGTVKISVEFSIDDFTVDKTTGVVYIHKFTITAITALGAKFTEVMEGSMLKSVKFSFGDYFNECKDNYCLFAQQGEIEVPKNVCNAISDGISLREKYGRGGTQELYHNMKRVVESCKMPTVQLSEMQQYFSSMGDKEVPQGTRTKTNVYIGYQLFGGDSGKEWCMNLMRNAKGGKEVEEKNALTKMKIDNSKEAAVDSESWENPGKKLYEPLFEHSNVNELIYEAYLIAKDGFQDAPSEKLKYPHHTIKDNTLVCDVKGVQAALARAKQTGEFKDKEVWAHLHRHYKELGLDMTAFEEKNGGEPEMNPNDDIDYKVEIPDAGAKEEPKEVALDPDAVKAAEERCAALEKEKDELAAKLAEYTRKDEIACAMASVDEYGHCFSVEKCAELKKCAEELDKCAFDKKLCDEVMKFAKELKNKKESEDKEPQIIKNSFYNFQKDVVREQNQSELSGVIKRQHTRVN